MDDLPDHALDAMKQNADTDRVTADNREQLFECMKDLYLEKNIFFE